MSILLRSGICSAHSCRTRLSISVYCLLMGWTGSLLGRADRAKVPVEELGDFFLEVAGRETFDPFATFLPA
jgi:hypothetical protein